MKGKTFFLFSLAVLLIVGAFFVPPVLLRSSVSHLINKSFLTEASTPGLRPAGNIVDKLASFTDPETTSVVVNAEEDIGQLSLMLREELSTLYASGAIPQTAYQAVYDSIDAAISEGMWAERYCVIQPAKHLMFEVYVIELGHINGELVFDLSSEKILNMSYNLPDSELLALEYDETQTIRELQGWADYLDLKPGEISRTELSIEEIIQPEERRHPVMLKKIILTDDAGSSVPFCQTYAFWENTGGYFTWGVKY